MSQIVEIDKFNISRIIVKDCMEYSEIANKYSQAFIYDEVLLLSKLIDQNDADFLRYLKKLLSLDKSCEFETSMIDLKKSLINLLNSHDLFLDHYKKILKKIYDNTEKYDYEYLANYYYENYAGYKLFSDFRNYIQHNKLIDFEIEIRDHFFDLYIIKDELFHDKKISRKLDKEIQSNYDFKMSVLIDSWEKSINDFLFYCLYDLLKITENSIREYAEYLKNCGVEYNNLNIYLLQSNSRLISIPKTSIFKALKNIKNIDFITKYSELKEIIEKQKNPHETKFLNMFPEIKKELEKTTNNVFFIEYMRRFLDPKI